jgi:hypothetical protein
MMLSAQKVCEGKGHPISFDEKTVKVAAMYTRTTNISHKRRAWYRLMGCELNRKANARPATPRRRDLLEQPYALS